jgi:dihydrolipoamide dehydrogenase
MGTTLKTRLLVIGGGPGGYVAALRAAQLGIETVLLDGDRLGGTCLIRGCIPSKALIHAAGYYRELVESAKSARFGIGILGTPTLEFAETMRWKEGIVDTLNGGVKTLLRRAKVRVVSGWARFTDAKTCSVDTPEGATTITAEHVILATGSLPIDMPGLPFGDHVISSTGALSLTEVPPRLVIVGAGYIGLELGTAFAKFGSTVTVVEAQNRILPLYDAELVAPVRRWLEKHHVTLHLGAKALGMTDGALGIETAEGNRISLPADKVLVTIGRRPNTEGWGLEQMGIEMSGRFIKVDERCATSTRGVWAIGDLVGEPMLAHKASAQGEMVAEIISGQRLRFDAVAIPAVCFTEPEVVSVGVDPDIAAKREEVLVGQFPFQANGRALSMDAGAEGGFVRVVARKSDHRILGIQAVGKHISELSAQFVTIMEMGGVLEDVAGIIHAHPTLSEAFHESALKALGHAIHI